MPVMLALRAKLKPFLLLFFRPIFQHLQRVARWLALLLAVALATGCASVPPSPPPAPGDPVMQVWNGRLAIKVVDQPSQSFSASFELKGAARQGELSLFSPFGSKLALLTWNADRASLRTPQGQQDYPSLEALMQQATGTAVPVAALFDWLGGQATPVDGWQVDLSQQPQGRLLARRADPATELRVVLER